MIDDKILDLIEKDIEGRNTEAEAERLKASLASDAKARSYYEDVKRLAELLARVPLADTPPGFAREIMQRVAEKRQPVRSETSSWLATIRSLFAVKHPAPFAFSFGAGVAVGALVLFLASQGPSPRSSFDEVSGLMVPPADLHGFETLSTRGFEGDGVSGTVSTKSNGSVILAELEINSRDQANVVLEFPGGALRPKGFHQSGTSAVVSMSHEAIELAHSGKSRYTFILETGETASPTLRVKVRTSEPVFDGTLRVASQAGS